MKYRVPYRLLVAAAAMSCALWTGAASAQDGYLLKRGYKVGDVDKYKSTLHIESADGAFKVDLALQTTETVKEIRPDGTTVVTLKVDKAVRTVGGQETALPDDGREATLLIDKSGRVSPDDKSGAGGGVALVARILSLTRFEFLPDKRLKAGDEQEIKSKIEENGKTVYERKGTVKVVGLEKKSSDLPVESVKLKIALDSTVPSDDGEQKAHVDATAWIEPGTGKAVVASGKITGLKNRNSGQTSIDFKVQRTSAEQAAKTGSDK